MAPPSAQLSEASPSEADSGIAEFDAAAQRSATPMLDQMNALVAGGMSTMSALIEVTGLTPDAEGQEDKRTPAPMAPPSAPPSEVPRWKAAPTSDPNWKPSPRPEVVTPAELSSAVRVACEYLCSTDRPLYTLEGRLRAAHTLRKVESTYGRTVLYADTDGVITTEADAYALVALAKTSSLVAATNAYLNKLRSELLVWSEQIEKELNDRAWREEESARDLQEE